MPQCAAQEIYTLHFAGEPDVHLVRRTSSRCIDLVTTAADLENLRNAEVLAALLELNGRDESNFTPTVMLDRTTRVVLVKVRLPESVVDVALLTKMLDGVRQQSAAVRRVLSPPAIAPVAVAPRRRAATLR